MAMLIPSIDLMGGKVVQLVQGRRKALEFDDFHEWVTRFSKYPLVQLIDLDAAIGTGTNAGIVEEIARILPCQVGGGIRSTEAVNAALKGGAQRVILGSSLFSDGLLNAGFAKALADEFGNESLVFALDAVGGRVSTHGWRKVTDIAPLEMIQALEPWCEGFLYTNVDTEGTLQGFPIETIRPLRESTERHLIAAGGIRSQNEIDELHAMGVDAVVGMAIYQGLIPA
jgi:phosphoribosylformimino-5-aminoimidazole carboxamide ribotide isomerase